MAVIGLAQIRAGMVLAANLLDPNGRQILPLGATLSERHITALKMWGIARVSIQSDKDEERPVVKLSAEEAEAVEAYISRIFSLNKEHANHPLLKDLRQRSLRRMAEGSATTPERPVAKDTPYQLPEPGNITPEKIVARADVASSHPAVYARLMEVIVHPHSSADDIALVIGEDPSLTARLLRIANSSFFAFPGRIDTVSRAVTLIGTSQICDLALATSAAKLFNKIPAELVDQASFWKHSVACGVIARGLASLRRVPNVEQLFTIGILHDIGRAVLFIVCPDTANYVVRESARTGQSLFEVERQVLGFDHARLAQILLESWNLPMCYCEAIGRHHMPQAAQGYPVEAAVVNIADLAALALQMGNSGSRFVPLLNTAAWDSLGLSVKTVSGLIEESERIIDDMTAILAQD
jgi:HD-like signal output (HDOD) protein